MTNVIRFILGAVLLLSGSASFAQYTLSPNGTIKVGNLVTYCSLDTTGRSQFVPGSPTQRMVGARYRFLQAEIFVNDGDQGLPGLLYVGAVNDGQTEGYLLGSQGWQAYTGGTMPPFAILRNGLRNSVIRVPLDNIPFYLDVSFRLYMGYGALSIRNEGIVQSGITARAQARQKFPDRKIPDLDPDVHRVALIEEDMKRNNKYQFVLHSTNFPICEVGGGS